MFVIKSQQDKTINWPVSVEVAADGGKIQKFEFTGTFKRLNDDDKEALAADAKLNEPAEGGEEAANAWKERSVDSIMKVMTAWKGVADESGTPIDFNRDTLRTAARSADGLSILRAINIALSEINTGSRAKN